MARTFSTVMTSSCRLILGGFFVVAGCVKLWDLSAFQRAVDGFQMMPYVATAIVAVYLPWLELVSGIVVVCGRWAWRAGLLITTTLTALFLVALATAWARGLNPDCGCLGAWSDSVMTAFVRDVVLLGAALWIWRSSSHTPAPHVTRPASFGALV